jgi:putative ABC transport system permease protein
MVTHNPELAEQYSTRIVRLLDGNIIEDTDPVSEEEVAASKEKEEVSEPSVDEAANVASKSKKKKEKAKMSVFTAFRLSARNLISKKGRTAMVGFAGSIGIIGIAMVLAFSAGIKGYIASMQDDMLSGNPITISESTYDLTMLTNMMKQSSEENIIEKLPGKVYISSLVEYIAKMDSTRESVAVENVITKEYIDYLKAMPEEYYQEILFDYGVDLNNSIYSNFKLNDEDEGSLMSATAITAMYTTTNSAASLHWEKW